jgi:hypothetical protein
MNMESNKFHAKTAREQISGKLDSNISVVQKYLLKGMEKWIGDCNGMTPTAFGLPYHNILLFILIFIKY